MKLHETEKSKVNKVGKSTEKTGEQAIGLSNTCRAALVIPAMQRVNEFNRKYEKGIGDGVRELFQDTHYKEQKKTGGERVMRRSMRK